MAWPIAAVRPAPLQPARAVGPPFEQQQERVIDPHDSVVRRGAGRSNDPVLRAKYLDWCSARVANRFVKLTPEEIYQLAERAVRDQRGRSGERAGLPSRPEPTPAPVGRAAAAEAGSGDRSLGADMSFRAIVERVTEALTAELNLPDFDEWARAYRSSPERFDDELLGLWREPL